jgi:hypothetical protein
MKNYAIFPFRIDFKRPYVDLATQTRSETKTVDEEFTVLVPPYRGTLEQVATQYKAHERPIDMSEAITMATTISLDGASSMVNGGLWDYCVNETILTCTRTIIQGIRLPKLLNHIDIANLKKLEKRNWNVHTNRHYSSLNDATFSLRMHLIEGSPTVSLNFDTPLCRTGVMPRVIDYNRLNKIRDRIQH